MKIFTLLTFTIAISSPSLLIAAELSGKVTRVLDGDTIEVLQDKTPVRVRLANIDAPEKKQPFGSWSSKQLKSLIAGQPVTVTYMQKDRYGRVIGRVFTANGTESNRLWCNPALHGYMTTSTQILPCLVCNGMLKSKSVVYGLTVNQRRRGNGVTIISLRGINE